MDETRVIRLLGDAEETGGVTATRGFRARLRVRRAKLVVLASALLLVVGAHAAAGAERPLPLMDAVRMALEKNERIIIERESLAAAEAAVTGARGAYDPFLELQGGWQRVTEPVNSAFSGAPEGEPAPTTEVSDAGASLRQLLPSGGELSLRLGTARTTTDDAFTLLSPAWDTAAGVEFRQPLLRARAVDATRLSIRVATADRELAGASLRRVVGDTVAEVEWAYWRLLAARREVAVQEEAVGLADEQLAETQIRISSGAAPETEIAQPRAELERRRGDLLASREASSRAENVLKLLILGDDDELWLDRLVPADEPPAEATPGDLANALERALASRPELEGAAAVVTRRRAEAALANDSLKPRLDAVMSYARFGLAGGSNPAGGAIPGFPAAVPPGQEGGWRRSWTVLGQGEFDDSRVGLVFALPLGNRSSRAAAATAAAGTRQAEAELARARKFVRAEVLDAASALETTAGRIEATRAAREAAEVQLAAERERYAVGLSTNFLVLTRQNDLARARLDENSALTDHRIARTRMARATGSLLEERGIVIDQGPTSTQ
ncbi:MAG: TolC family protein [Acidobacteria bacterium]|nr:TolC family protein [Acidobacteriota bacterium]